MTRSILDALRTVNAYCVSSGTLRTYDLANAFLEALCELAPAVYQQLVFPCGMTPDYLRAIDEGRSCEYWDTDEASEFVNELQDTLCNHAPEGYYFGASEGDGACFGFWETEDRVAEREWSEFTSELADIADSTLATLRTPRKVHLSDSAPRNGCVGPECNGFYVFAFGAYGATYIAVPYEQNGHRSGADFDDALESAAETLLGVAPGCFTTPDMQAARDELLAEGAITADEYVDFDSDEVIDRVYSRATVDLTYTESGYIASWEWAIVGTLSRAELLAFARGE